LLVEAAACSPNGLTSTVAGTRRSEALVALDRHDVGTIRRRRRAAVRSGTS
jgi:hypothetical protein